MKPRYVPVTILCLIGLFFSNPMHSQLCQGGFTASIDSLDVQFTNQSSGAYNYIYYSYGDGSADTGIEDPTHVYAASGFYEVCQVIQDTNGGCFDYTCDTIGVGEAGCLANFYWSVSSLEAYFSNNSLGDYDSLAWSFGDGTFSSVANPTHIYPGAGNYTACLYLYDSTSQVCDSMCQVIPIGASSCLADFTSNSSGLTVAFTNVSSGTFTDVSWDFGDGSGVSSQNNPTYTYASSGTYQVCLIIFDTITGLCFDQYCTIINVDNGGSGGPCQARFNYYSEELDLYCTNTSTGNIVTAIWDFGDNSAPSLSSSHTYEEAGTYEVCLSVGGFAPPCFDQICKTVEIVELNCDASFSYSFDLSNNIFAFTNTTESEDVTDVLWSFGDGNTSTFGNPYYNFSGPGTYEVCLTTFDNGQMCGYTCEDVEVFPLSIDALEQESFVVYPNPSNGMISIWTGENGSSFELVLRDVSGRSVYQSQHANVGERLELTLNVPPGIYVLDLKAEDHQSKSLKVIISE